MGEAQNGVFNKKPLTTNNIMQAFQQVECMVENGILTPEQGTQLKQIMASLPSSQGELLLFIAATNLMALSSGGGTAGGVFVSIPATGNITAVNGNNIIADTSAGSFSVTLPANPVVGNRVDIFDAQGTFGINSLTVIYNGQKIDGNLGNLVMNINQAHSAFVFNGGSTGWAVYNL